MRALLVGALLAAAAQRVALAQAPDPTLSWALASGVSVGRVLPYGALRPRLTRSDTSQVGTVTTTPLQSLWGAMGACTALARSLPTRLVA